MFGRFGKTTRYVLFGCCCFLIFLYIQFPYDLLLDQLIQKIEPQLSRRQTIKMEAKDLSPYLFPGVSIHQLKLLERGKVLFEAEKLSLRLRVLPLLTKDRSVSFRSRSYGGVFSGRVGRKAGRIHGKVRAKKINLKQATAGGGEISLPLEGLLNGRSEFNVSPKNMKESVIQANLQIENGKFGPGNIKGFEIAKAIRLDDNEGPTPVTLTMQEGVFKPTVKFTNPDGQVDLKGEVQYTNNIRTSRLNIEINFNLSDSVRQTLPSVLFSEAFLGKAKGPDGSFTYQVQGMAGRPRWTPIKR